MTRKFLLSGYVVSNDDQEIYEWIGFESTCPAQVKKFLDDSNGQDIEVDINSPGGDVWSGSDIYSQLKAYSGKVTVNIVGLAASIATVIAMGGNVVRMSPPAQFMIHCSALSTYGNHEELAHARDVLLNSDEGIRAAYKLKTGLSDEELSEMMNKETWLTADKAKEKGFIDEILFNETPKIQVANAIGTTLINEQTIVKLKNLIKESNPAQSNEADILMASANLQLLKLKEMGKTE